MIIRATRPAAPGHALAARVKQGQAASKRAAARAKAAAKARRRRVG